MTDECEHGHLARKCDLCCRDREIARLTAQRNELACEWHAERWAGYGKNDADTLLYAFGLRIENGEVKEIEGS